MTAVPTASSRSGPLGLSGYHWLALLLCALTFLVEGYDMSAMSLAGPTLAHEWGLKATKLGTAIVALNIGAVIGNGFIAPLGDTFGRKRTITGSMLLLGLCVGFTAVSGSLSQLVAWRFVSGLAFGVATANVVALIAEQFPSNRRALLVVIAATNLGVGSAIAGFATPAITAAGGWRALFLVGGVAGVALALAIGAFIRHDVGGRVEPQDTSATGLASNVPIVRLFAPDLIGVTIPLWLIGFCNASILFVMLNWLPTMLTNSGWTLAQSTRAPAIVSIGGILSGLVLAFLVDTGFATRGLRVTFFGLIVTMALFAFAPPSVFTWTLLLLVAGLLCSGAHNVERGLYATLYPKAVRATGVGWGNMMSRLGNIISTSVVAVLIDLHFEVGKTLALLAVPALLSLLCTIPLGRAYAKRRVAEALSVSN